MAGSARDGPFSLIWTATRLYLFATSQFAPADPLGGGGRMKRAIGLYGLLVAIAIAAAACAPSNRGQCDPNTLQTDPDNCGYCGNVCGDNQGCVAGACV